MVPVRLGSRAATTRVVCLPRACARRRHAVVFGGLSRANAGSDATDAAAPGGNTHDCPRQPAGAVGEFLYSAPDAEAPSESSYHQLLSRHLPSVSQVHRTAVP